MVLIFKEKDVTREKDLESEFTRKTFPTFLKNMETLLATRGGKHFVGSEVLSFALAYTNIDSSCNQRWKAFGWK